MKSKRTADEGAAHGRHQDGDTKLPPGFECDAPAEGYYSATEYYWIIRPASEYRYDAHRGWLCIGGPGVDGIEFGLLQGKQGVFAWYPTTDEYVWKAHSVTDLIQGWANGEIRV